VQGAFERPLNIYRCIYSYVNQSRKGMPDAIGGVSWIGFDRPANAVYLPFYCGVPVPDCAQRGVPLEFDRSSLWMVFNYVANYATLKYSYMIKDINALQQQFEGRYLAGQAEIEARAQALWQKNDEAGARALLTDYVATNANELLDAWWKLSETLYLKYCDGYLNTKEELAKPLFYPSWWLRSVGYENGPLSYEEKAR